MPQKRHRKVLRPLILLSSTFPLSVLAQKMSKNRFALATANFTQRSQCIFTLFVLLITFILTPIQAVTFAKTVKKVS